MKLVLYFLGLEGSPFSVNSTINVTNMRTPVLEAKEITVVSKTNLKSIDFLSQIATRLHRSYINKLLTNTNVISILFYGKSIKFEIKTIESSDIECSEFSATSGSLEGCFTDLSINVASTGFHKVVEATRWKLFK